MTWLGDTSESKPSDKKRATLLLKREGFIAEIEALKKRGPIGRFAHNVQHHLEDMKAIALKVTRIDGQLGRCVDRNSGG